MNMQAVDTLLLFTTGVVVAPPTPNLENWIDNLGNLMVDNLGNEIVFNVP